MVLGKQALGKRRLASSWEATERQQASASPLIRSSRHRAGEQCTMDEGQRTFVSPAFNFTLKPYLSPAPYSLYTLCELNVKDGVSESASATC